MKRKNIETNYFTNDDLVNTGEALTSDNTFFSGGANGLMEVESGYVDPKNYTARPMDYAFDGQSHWDKIKKAEQAVFLNYSDDESVDLRKTFILEHMNGLSMASIEQNVNKQQIEKVLALASDSQLSDKERLEAKELFEAAKSGESSIEDRTKLFLLLHNIVVCDQDSLDKFKLQSLEVARVSNYGQDYFREADSLARSKIDELFGIRVGSNSQKERFASPKLRNIDRSPYFYPNDNHIRWRSSQDAERFRTSCLNEQGKEEAIKSPIEGIIVSAKDEIFKYNDEWVLKHRLKCLIDFKELEKKDKESFDLLLKIVKDLNAFKLQEKSLVEKMDVTRLIFDEITNNEKFKLIVGGLMSSAYSSGDYDAVKPLTSTYYLAGLRQD